MEWSQLEGLRRLEEVCRRHGLPVERVSLEGRGPGPGELFLGQPFDPVLSAIYREMGGATLGELHLYSMKGAQSRLQSINEGMRWGMQEPYLSCLLFGQIQGMAYYLATVPPLADPKGFQPVVFIDGYEGDQVLPVASSVDEFFMTYAMYVERLVATPEYMADRHVSLHFPTSVPELIARDKALVEALTSGRFSALMGEDEESRRWVSQLL